MEFAKDSITEHDTQGRLCSLWCLERGHIACANRVIPEEFLTDQDGALEYLREEQEGLIKAKCLKLPLFLDGIGHLWQYLLFARLRPGDLVILQLKAGARAPGEAVFGFIEDDSFIVKTKKQILKEENFPWKLDRGTTLDPWANGLMLRKVKWMRRGVMRDLPKQMITKRGDKQVSWMLENVTTFLVEVKNTKETKSKPSNRRKNRAFSVMRSEAFLRTTEPLDQAWIDGEKERWSKSS